MISTRQATVADIPWILKQLRDFDHFFGAGRSLFPEDPSHAERIIAGLIANHVFYVALEHAENDVAGFGVGFIAGHLAQHPFNPDITMLTELFWWVEPASRGTRAGSLLLDAYVAAGRTSAHWVLMTLEHDSPVNDRMLLKRGFKPKERSYLLEVA